MAYEKVPLEKFLQQVIRLVEELQKQSELRDIGGVFIRLKEDLHSALEEAKGEKGFEVEFGEGVFGDHIKVINPYTESARRQSGR